MSDGPWTAERYRSLARFMRTRKVDDEELERHRSVTARCAISHALTLRSAREIKAFLAGEQAEIRLDDVELRAKIRASHQRQAELYEDLAAKMDAAEGVAP